MGYTHWKEVADSRLENHCTLFTINREKYEHHLFDQILSW